MLILDENCLYLNCRERPPCRSAGCTSETAAAGRIRTEFPNALPRGEGGPKGRVRNAGGNMKVSKKRTDLHPSRSSRGGLQIFIIVRLPPAFLISHQSVPKSRLATARNCGVIAPGNHWILDSLRGAPPPGEAFWWKLATFLLLIHIPVEAMGAAAPVLLYQPKNALPGGRA